MKIFIPKRVEDRRRLVRRVALILGCFIGFGINLRAVAGDSALGQRIERFFQDATSKGLQLGVAVVDLSNGAVVCDINADQPLIPASNQKVLALATAIDQLGEDFEFRTVLGLLGRDLVIVADGDPAIGDPSLSGRANVDVYHVLTQWADALIATGITRIDGDLIIDESIFDDQLVHPTWSENDLPKHYAAPVGALNFHTNCIEITVQPTDKGDPPTWRAIPDISVLTLENRARSASKGVPVIKRLSDQWSFELSGSCGRQATLAPVSIRDPGMLFAHSFLGVLRGLGVKVAGRVQRGQIRTPNGRLPSGFRRIAEHHTSITDVLDRIGKNSQNLFAECLAKRIGYHFMRQRTIRARGSWVAAAAAVNDFLNRHQIDTNGTIIADASGLSRENRLTASLLSDVFRCMALHPQAKTFRSSLAVAGDDGSLRRRMRDLKGRVIAKTGTLTGVTSLSGYVMNGSQPRFAFSVIVNDISGSVRPWRRRQDELCRMLVSELDSSAP